MGQMQRACSRPMSLARMGEHRPPHTCVGASADDTGVAPMVLGRGAAMPFLRQPSSAGARAVLGMGRVSRPGWEVDGLVGVLE